MWASGKNSLRECSRCGFPFPYNTIKQERGTKYRVCPKCYDGAYDLVDHPQNKAPKVAPDPQAMKNPLFEQPVYYWQNMDQSVWQFWSQEWQEWGPI